jgi:hypothetical protein
MNLVEKIFEQMELDDDDWEEQSEILLETWREASEDRRRVIDEVLVALCGWTMKSLIRMTPKRSLNKAAE